MLPEQKEWLKTRAEPSFYYLYILYIVYCSVLVEIEGMEMRSVFALAPRLDRSAFFTFLGYPLQKCQNTGTTS